LKQDPSKERIGRIIDEFNRYRRPEVVASPLVVEGNVLELIFRGTACASCGGQDYIEDFAYEASDGLGRMVTLGNFEALEGGGYRARYEIGEE